MTPVKFTPDGRPVVYLVAAHNHHPNNKDSSVSNIDSLCKTLENLPVDVKLELAKRLNSDVVAQLSAAADEKAKKTRLSKIQAMRDGRDPAFQLIAAALNRAGIRLDDAVDIPTLDKLFAAASRPVDAEQRIMIKAGLHRLRLLVS
jgi:hypothetical protein